MSKIDGEASENFEMTFCGRSHQFPKVVNGQFKIGEFIGEGSTCLVYECEDTKNQFKKRLVIKIVRRGPCFIVF